MAMWFKNTTKSVAKRQKELEEMAKQKEQAMMEKERMLDYMNMNTNGPIVSRRISIFASEPTKADMNNMYAEYVSCISGNTTAHRPVEETLVWSATSADLTVMRVEVVVEFDEPQPMSRDEYNATFQKARDELRDLGHTDLGTFKPADFWRQSGGFIPSAPIKYEKKRTKNKPQIVLASIQTVPLMDGGEVREIHMASVFLNTPVSHGTPSIQSAQRCGFTDIEQAKNWAKVTYRMNRADEDPNAPKSPIYVNAAMQTGTATGAGLGSMLGAQQSNYFGQLRAQQMQQQYNQALAEYNNSINLNQP